MFNLMLWAYRRVKQSDTVVEVQEELHRLEEQLQPLKQFKKTGRVTIVRRDFIVIDEDYSVSNDMLKSDIGCETIEKNTLLSFLVQRKSDGTRGESTMKVVKILSIDDKMETSGHVVPYKAKGVVGGSLKEQVQEQEQEQKQLQKQVQEQERERERVQEQEQERHEVQGVMIGESTNEITVETYGGDLIHVNKRQVRMSFVPVLYDYLILECNDLDGGELQVIAIKPSYPCNGTGQILAITPVGGTINIFNETYVYQSECLADSYRPSVGDTVQFQAIENEQEKMRFLSVKPKTGPISGDREFANENALPECEDVAEVVSGEADGSRENSGLRRNPTVGQAAQNEVGKGKPILIVGNFEVKLQSLDETVERTIILKNQSNTHQMIKLVKASQGHSLVTLKNPVALTQYRLYPGETAEYVFSITGGAFLGRHREQVVWMLQRKFSVSRTFIITIGDVAEEAVGPAIVQSSRPVYDARQKALLQKQAALTVLREQEDGLLLRGRGLFKQPNFVATTIPVFSVPPGLFEMVLTTNDSGELLRTLSQAPYFLDKPLAKDNYVKRFRHCVFLEEIRQCIEFRQHDMEQVEFLIEDKFLALHVPNIIEARPSLLVGNVVNATALKPREGELRPLVIQGVIHKVLQNRILLKFDSIVHGLYKGESYRISFSYSRGSYRNMHQAIGLVKSNWGMERLVPLEVKWRVPYLNVRLNDRDELEMRDTSRRQASKLLPWQNPNLNRYQKAAIVNVLRGEARPLPYVIFGPPGTGKTITTVELIHQLVLNAPDCRLIVATPSNSAAYLITERLTSVFNASQIIRLVSANQVERNAIPPHLADYCAMVDISEDGTSSGGQSVTRSGLRKCQSHQIACYRVTISTCSTTGMLMRLGFPSNHFTHAIIDEAGQTVEPETLIPLTLISPEFGSVTLVGDPEQLGPTVQSNEACAFGYNISLLERLLKTAPPYGIDESCFPDTHGYNPRLVTKLCINYRTIPSVLALYSDIFYDSQLVPVKKNTAADTALLTTLHGILEVKRPTADYGFFVCGIDSINKQVTTSPSWFNPLEAAMVQKIVKQLVRKNYKPEEIGIVTPYLSQVKLIRTLLASASLGSSKVGSVEEFQGQERRIMIVSTVRSSTAQLMYDKRAVLGFISDPKRINVAISRAKVALIVVGNPNLLGFNATWLQVLRRAVDNGTYVGCTLSEPVLAAIQTGTPMTVKPYMQKTSGS